MRSTQPCAELLLKQYSTFGTEKFSGSPPPASHIQQYQNWQNYLQEDVRHRIGSLKFGRRKGIMLINIFAMIWRCHHRQQCRHLRRMPR